MQNSQTIRDTEVSWLYLLQTTVLTVGFIDVASDCVGLAELAFGRSR